MASPTPKSGSRPQSGISPGGGTASGGRLPLVDLLRGLAIVQMVCYHFTYDLNYFGWLHLQMGRDQPWVAWRTAIVSQFLLLLGAGLVLRGRSARPAARFWRRWGQIALAAAAVSCGSYLMFDSRFIWFGILHFAASALLLARPAPRLGAVACLAAGLGVIVAGLLWHSESFQPDWLSWIGFAPRKPATEDFVPLFPWFGVVLLGVALALRWRAMGYPGPAAGGDAMARSLVFIGQWPLTIYLVHQPILIGILWCTRNLALPALR